MISQYRLQSLREILQASYETMPPSEWRELVFDSLEVLAVANRHDGKVYSDAHIGDYLQNLVISIEGARARVIPSAYAEWDRFMVEHGRKWGRGKDGVIDA